MAVAAPGDGINLFVSGAIKSVGEIAWSVDEAIAAVDPASPVIVLQMDVFKGIAGLVAGRLASEFGFDASTLLRMSASEYLSFQAWAPRNATFEGR
mgnify:CR=1 FL=1